jgi:hypothetical protein
VARGRGGLTDRVVRYGLRAGWRKGLGDGSQVWLAVGAVAAAVRLLQRMAGPGKPVVVTERLAPGESLVIRHLPPGE